MLVASGLSLGLALKETGLAPNYDSILQGYNLNFLCIVVVFTNFMNNNTTATSFVPIILVSKNTELLQI